MVSTPANRDERRPVGRVFGLPTSRPGHWSLGFLGGAAMAFVVANLGVALGQTGGDTFFDNPFLAFAMLTAGACAVASGTLAAFAIATRRDRSAWLFAAAFLGLLVLFFVTGELIGHE